MFVFHGLCSLKEGVRKCICCLMRRKLVTVAFLWFGEGERERGEEGERKLRKQ